MYVYVGPQIMETTHKSGCNALKKKSPPSHLSLLIPLDRAEKKRRLDDQVAPTALISVPNPVAHRI